MYSHIIGVDDELWDINEDGIDIPVNEGVVVDRKKLTTTQNKIYIKHHKVRGIIVEALPHSEYLKLSDKSTAKAIITSLCSNNEGNKKFREVRANHLVQRYELFTMKEDENIGTMFSRFQTLVSGLQILKKSYSTSDLVNKILRSFPAK